MLMGRSWKLFVLVVALATVWLSVAAQEADSLNAGKAALLIMQAELQYDNGDYEEAIELLDRAQNYLDTTTSNVQYLLAKSNMAINRKKQAQKDVHKYVLVTSGMDTLTDQFKEMVALKDTLDKELGEIKPERDVAGLIGGGFNEQETWDYAKRTSSLNAYENYVKFFPDGIYVAQAKQFIDYEKKKRETPSKFLVDAVKQGNMREVRNLVESGTVDVNYVVTYKATFERPSGNAYDLYFETPLYMALYKFDYTMVKYLLENGADPNRFTTRKIYDYKEGGRTRSVLESMVIATSKSGIHAGKDDELGKFIDLMLEHGLDINFYQGSPLATAVFFHDKKEYNRYKLIRHLLRKGADPKLPGWADGKMSALDIAYGRGDDRLVDILKDKRYKQKRKEIAKKKAKEQKQLQKEYAQAVKEARQERKTLERQEKLEAEQLKEQEKLEQPAGTNP